MEGKHAVQNTLREVKDGGQEGDPKDLVGGLWDRLG